MTEQSLVRFTPSLAKVLDAWRGDQLDTPTRADAIRRLFSQALKDMGYRLPTPDETDPKARKARKL